MSFPVASISAPAALRRDGDPPEYAQKLLRQTWLVWSENAPPPLLPDPPLQQHSSQAEVSCYSVKSSGFGRVVQHDLDFVIRAPQQCIVSSYGRLPLSPSTCSCWPGRLIG
jgi:hypothetical protein